jgi:hypothetical protein
VLVRLLLLNRQRALEEGQAVPSEAAQATTPDPKTKKAKSKKSKAKSADQVSPSGLFAMDHGEV